jgi:hypothetical protein
MIATFTDQNKADVAVDRVDHPYSSCESQAVFAGGREFGDIVEEVIGALSPDRTCP